MNFWALSGLVNGLFSSIFGLLIFLKSPRNISHKLWLLFSFTVAVWSYSYFFWQISSLRIHALLWCRILTAAAIFIPVTLLHFLLVWLGLFQKKKKIIYFCYGVNSIAFVLSFTSLFIKNVSPILSFKYWPQAGIAYLPFLVFWGWLVLYCWYIMFREIKTASPQKRTQIKYILLGAIIGFSGGSTNYPLWYGIKIFPYGNILVSIYIGLMSYAILRYRLMDIKVVITRTGVFIAVYTLLLGIPFAIAVSLRSWLIGTFGTGWWMAPLVLMGIFATIAPFIYIYLSRRAEERILKEQRRYQDTLRQASVGMTRIRDMQKLLKLIVHIVTRAVQLDYAGIYLLDRENSYYKLVALRGKGPARMLSYVKVDDPLVKCLLEEKEPLVSEEIGRRPQQNKPAVELEKLNEQLTLLSACVVIPSFVENNLLGFLVLGDKRSGAIYSQDDLNVFTVLANQAALAIDNARFFEDAKELQEQISQAEKMATIGTMADGLSHQINNRFYALSLIAGDTLDTVKLTDTTSYTSEQRELLSQIKYALERIQSNVVSGGEIVKGMLKYTRKGEEGFSAVALDKIIDSTLEMVQYKIKLSELDIIRDYPRDTPAINGNLTQLQEVFFNLIDNAYDAMVERRETLKEPGYRGKIRIYTESSGNGYLKINVEDNGIGAKHEDFRKMFTPFFTTKVSSKKGTGLGLYVIKKIITSNHYGKISFESTYKQGTKFILELPLAAIREETVQ